MLLATAPLAPDSGGTAWMLMSSALVLVKNRREVPVRSEFRRI